MSPPNFDALATAFAALGVAIAIGSVLVGLLAIFITFSWNRTTQSKAKDIARETAREEALRFITGPEGKRLFDEGAKSHFSASESGQGAVPGSHQP